LDKGDIRSKKERLTHRLGKLGGLVVAFSGGVDSALLLVAAHQALGENALAAMAVSLVHPRREQNEAARFAMERGIKLVQLQTHEMAIPEFVANGIDRCYHCKTALSAKLLELARTRGLSHVAHGANVDDLKDYRPGFKAAQEAGIIAPLIDAQLGKAEIRFLAREMALPQWNKPAMACLATRFPYGRPITEQGLRMVESAEEFLLSEGFSAPRVRHDGTVARIEVDPLELSRLLSDKSRLAVVERLRRIGFEHVVMDLEGYVSGKMNRGIGELRDSGMEGVL